MSKALPATTLASCGTDIWRGRQALQRIPTLTTGYDMLDRQLPGGGWPLGSLTELVPSSPGSGEFSLLLPALAEVSRQGSWGILLDPPWIPYPPAMSGHGVNLDRIMVIHTDSTKESLWACEQALRGVRGGAVLAWHETLDFAQLRRLQLAARSGHKLAFVFRSPGALAQPSPAALRLGINVDPAGTCITVHKCRGQRPQSSIVLRRNRTIPGQCHIPGQPAETVPEHTHPPRSNDAPRQHLH